MPLWSAREPSNRALFIIKHSNAPPGPDNTDCEYPVTALWMLTSAFAAAAQGRMDRRRAFYGTVVSGGARGTSVE